jgi:hypothetical protein
MKGKLLLVAALCVCVAAFGQADTTGRGNQSGQVDTIRIGSMLIIKNRGEEYNSYDHATRISRRHYYRPSNFSTNWVIVDIGFANYTDKTNYLSAGAQKFAPGSTSDWFNLRTGKSVDVNIWLFMQRLNLIKNVVNLKYGLGIELNNYRYSENVKFMVNPTTVVLDSINYSKDKLAADYVTIPFMLNFNFTPHRREGFGLSVGASVGYLYSSRQKFISHQTGKYKVHNDFDLDPWKISWVGELQLGPVKLYGSYAVQSMFTKGLDQIPYTAGIRLSNW